jgi:hypothetical protein
MFSPPDALLPSLSLMSNPTSRVDRMETGEDAGDRAGVNPYPEEEIDEIVRVATNDSRDATASRVTPQDMMSKMRLHSLKSLEINLLVVSFLICFVNSFCKIKDFRVVYISFIFERNSFQMPLKISIHKTLREWMIIKTKNNSNNITINNNNGNIKIYLFLLR